MNNSEFTTLLRKMKNAPEFGGWVQDEQVKAGWSRIARELGFEEKPQKWSYHWKDYAEYVGHLMQAHVLRPVSVGLSAFLVIFGGWVVTVNASFDSVPGDILYPVKLVTEKMQITFAASSEQRARLHAEFAGRRLEEVVVITNSDREGKPALVETAMEGFKSELAFANDELESVQSSSPSAAVSLAVVLDHKTEEYEAVISQSESEIPEETKASVAEALVAVEETNQQAIDTLVQSHEATQEVETEEHLQQNFQQQYQDLKNRIALNIGRLSVIRGRLETAGNLTIDYATRIEEARVTLVGHDDSLADAEDMLAAGGYRRAFELLQEVEANISASEQIIVELEIEISTALAASAATEAPITTPEF